MNRDRAALSEILERMERAIEFAGPDRHRFMESALQQEAVIRQLEVVGEAAKRVSAPTRNRSVEVPWRGMAGFKDFAIHPYDSIDLERVWAIVQNELPGIRAKVRAVFSTLARD